jgi:hypothetical protein
MSRFNVSHLFMRIKSPFVLLCCGAFCVSSSQADSTWPQFRGVNSAGVSDGGKPPVYFGVKSNVLWKTEVPSGVSSPSVARDRIFITAFEEGKLVTIGVDARSGKVLWKQAVPATKIESVHKMGSPASATPASARMA